MNFHAAEKYRKPHPAGYPHKRGNKYGWFRIPSKTTGGVNLRCMVAPDNSEWQHVSISTNVKRCPTWDEMCQIKDMFFDPEDVVVQFHPKKSEYVNNATNCLHLWRMNYGSGFPRPPKILVGV